MSNLIGTAPNQVPVNGMLGTAAFINAEQLPVSAPTQAALDAMGEVVDDKQATLVSGTNIKTVGGQTILGSGDIEIANNDVIAVSALNIDCSLGGYFTKTIAANSTFTFSNIPSGRVYAFTLELTHTSGTVTWPSTVKWPYDAAPALTSGKTHLFVFVTDDGGTRWRGSALTNYTN